MILSVRPKSVNFQDNKTNLSSNIRNSLLDAQTNLTVGRQIGNYWVQGHLGKTILDSISNSRLYYPVE